MSRQDAVQHIKTFLASDPELSVTFQQFIADVAKASVYAYHGMIDEASDTLNAWLDFQQLADADSRYIDDTPVKVSLDDTQEIPVVE